MKNIKVQLLSVTPEHVLNNAIAMPYQTEPSKELTQKVICTLGHLSPAEHAVLSFKVTGSSRLELQEHVRHRIAAYTVQSTRYTLRKLLKYNNVDGGELQRFFVIPEGDETLVNKIKATYATFINLYRENPGNASDTIKYMVPEGLRTNFMWTINLRSLINFLQLRLDKKAHFEIRHIAKLIRKEIDSRYISNYISDILNEYFKN